MRLVERLSRARDDFIFGYDWNDSSAFDQRDMQSEGGRAAVNWGDKQSVWRSYYFKGWCERIKAEMLVLAQLGYKIVLVCIEGGPITRLDTEVMPTLVEEIKGDLAMKQISCDVRIDEVSFDDFRQAYEIEVLWEELATRAKAAGIKPPRTEDWAAQSGHRRLEQVARGVQQS